MSLYQPIRDAFHEMNQLLIDKQQFDAELKQRAVNQAMQNKILESKLQDAALQRKALQVQAAKNEYLLTPQPVNISSLFGNDEEFLTNKKYQEDVQKVFDPNNEGIKISPADGTIVDRTGNPIQMTPLEFGNKLPILNGIKQRYANAPAKIQTEINDLIKHATKLQTEIKMLESDQRWTPHVAKMKKALQDTQAAISKRQQFLTPENMLQYYTKKAASQQQFAQIALQMGNYQAVKYFEGAAKEFSTVRDKILISMLKKDKVQRELKRAVKLNNDGQIISSKYIAVPKNIPVGVTPGMLDPNSKDYVWEARGVGAKEKEKSFYKLWNIKKAIDLNYGKLSPDGSILITPGLEGIRQHTEDIANYLVRKQMKLPKEKRMTGPEIVAEATRIAQTDQKTLYNDIANIQKAVAAGKMSKIKAAELIYKKSKLYKKVTGYLPTEPVVDEFGNQFAPYLDMYNEATQTYLSNEKAINDEKTLVNIFKKIAQSNLSSEQKQEKMRANLRNFKAANGYVPFGMENLAKKLGVE